MNSWLGWGISIPIFQTKAELYLNKKTDQSVKFIKYFEKHLPSHLFPSDSIIKNKSRGIKSVILQANGGTKNLSII